MTTTPGFVSFQPRPSTIEPTPKQTEAHDRLRVFLGEWRSEGHTVPAQFGAVAEVLSHTHSYRWLPGNFHIYHRWNGHIGAHLGEGVEIIGYDLASRSYEFHFFDSDGWARIYRGHVDGRTWTLTGERERCTMTFSIDGRAMTTEWERSPDGKAWEPLCLLRAVRL